MQRSLGWCRQVAQRGRIPAAVPAVLVAGALSLLLGACGGGSLPAAKHAGASPSTSRPTTSSVVDPASTAVLAAYRAEWAAFEQASATSNAFDPSLPATMVDPMLQLVRRNLIGDQAAGIVARGTFVLHPRVVSITGSTAVVVDCAYSTSVLVYATSGKPVPPVTPPENDGVHSTLVLSGSTWKVSEQTVKEGLCPFGS